MSDEAPTVDTEQTPRVAPVVLPDLGSGSEPGPARPIAAIAGVEMNVSVQVGTIPVKLSDLAGLLPGAVLEMDRRPDEPMLMQVNDRAFALCDIVVDEGQVAARISEIRTTAHG